MVNPHASEEPYLGQGCGRPYSPRETVLRWLWVLVESTLFRWSPRPWHGFRARLLRLFGAEIPSTGEVVVFPTATILHPWMLTLAPRAMIGPLVRIYNPGRVTIHRGANISQLCHLCAGTHDYSRWSMPLMRGPIAIGANAWLCTEVFVGPGVTIGELSVIGARSVVVSDQPANKVCAGNPCKPVKDRLAPQ